MKYESELIKEIVDTRGHETPLLHYESECIEAWIDEAKGAYPKLTDYCSEWLNYIVENPIGEFPYITLSDVTDATVDNVVPYAYKSAILKGRTLILNNGNNLASIEHYYFNTERMYSIPLITPLKKGITYTVSFNLTSCDATSGITCRFLGTGIGNEVISTIKEIGVFKTIYTPSNNYTHFNVYISDSDFANKKYASFEQLIIVEGEEIPSSGEMKSVKMPVLTTSNEDGTKTNILTVNEPVELRGIGDVQDTLDCLTGEVIERIGEIVLDGTQDMVSDGYGAYIQVNDVKRFLDYTDKIACDKLPVIPTYWDLENVENGISGYANSNSYLGQNWLYVKINNSVNTDEVKEWLSQNPITVQYQLATESVKTVDLSITDQDGNTLSKIRPIEGTMHLVTSSDTLKPTFSGEIPVEATTQNLASFITE